MSRSAHLLLGSAILALTTLFLTLIWLVPELKAMRGGPGLVLAGFLLLISVACFSRTARPLVLRFIAWAVLAFCLMVIGIAGAEIRTINDLLPWETPGQNLFKSLGMFILIGLPSAYVAWHGRYPDWGRHAFAFRDTSPNPEVDQ